MFKVGDKVRRIEGYLNRTVRTVSEVGANGAFNYENSLPDDHAVGGGCLFEYWELAPVTCEVSAHKAEYRARSNDPATSKGKRKVNKYEQAVLDVLAGAHHTGKEIAAVSGQPLNSITPRFAPLRRKELIKDSGVRRDKQIVWCLA